MFTCLYPWTPHEYYRVTSTLQGATAFGDGKPDKPGGWQTVGGGYGPLDNIHGERWYGLILSRANNIPALGGLSYGDKEHFWQQGNYTCGTPLPAYSPWIGSNTNQTTTPHRVWDTGTIYSFVGPPRNNVYPWPGGSKVLPFSASAVLQQPGSGSYTANQFFSPRPLSTNATPAMMFAGDGRGQRPNNDSGFIGTFPNLSTNFSMAWLPDETRSSPIFNRAMESSLHSAVVAVVVDSGSTALETLLYKKPQYQYLKADSARHYPSFAPASPAHSSSFNISDRSSGVNVASTTFLLHPEDTLILGVEKINVPPALTYLALGATLTGSHPSVAGSGSFQSSNDGGNDDRKNAIGGRFYGVAPDHYREHYNAGVHSASFLRITSENQSWLRLYGSLVKNGRQYYSSSPQQLTTDAVHEALHYDNPVLDQWEIAGEIEYTGSLRTQYITGRMTRPRIGTQRKPYSSSHNPVHNDGISPGYVGAKADDGVVGYSNRRIIADNSSGYGDMFSFNRNITVVENRKVYYDSLTPVVSRLWNRDGFQAATWYSSFYQGGGKGDGYGGSLGGNLFPAGNYGDGFGGGASAAGNGGEYISTRKYYFGWLMGHGTGSRSRNAVDGTVCPVRYFLNGWDAKYNAQPFGMTPGNLSPTNTWEGKHYFTLNTGSTGAAIEGLSSPAVPLHGQVGNHVWPAAFPFEPRYKGIRRVLNQDFSYASNLQDVKGAIQRPAGSGSSFSEYVLNKGRPGVTFGGAGYVIDGNVETALPPSARHARNSRSSISIVCTVNRNSLPVTDDYITYLHRRRPKDDRTCAFSIFGRGYSNKYLDVIKSVGSYTTMPDDGADPGTDTGGFWGMTVTADSGLITYNSASAGRNRNSGSYGVVAKPAGFKYGLINAIEQNPVAVYRGSKFGQFRDMLEQRPYTRFFDKNLNLMARNQWVVRNRFQEPTWTDPSGKIEKKEPSETQSSNLSVFSTSSLPFFDDIELYPNGRNRGGMAADGDVSVMVTPGFRTAGGGFPGSGPFGL